MSLRKVSQLEKDRQWFHWGQLMIAAAFAIAVASTSVAPTIAQGSSYDVGLQLYKAGKYGPAANKLLEAVKYPGKEAAAYYYLGCCYYKLGQPQQARAIYRTVVSNYATTHEAGLASQMLQRLDPTYVAPAGIGAGAVAAASSATAEASAKDAVRRLAASMQGPKEDMSKLPDEARIPFTSDPSGHMRVKVYLDNRPIEALFDTGANAHFGLNHFEAAGIPRPRGEPNSFCSGWAGNKVPCWRLPMTIKMGDMTRNAYVTIEENMSLSPLVGQEFIHGYQCEVDGNSHYIVLKKMGTGKAATSQQVSDLYDIPCVRRSMRDYVPMTINGKKLEVLIDTGAQHSTFNPDDLAKIGIRVPDDAPVSTASGVGGSFTVRTMMVECRLGPIWRKDFPITVGGSAGSAVGQDFLGDKRFTIDRERNLMRFFH